MDGIYKSLILNNEVSLSIIEDTCFLNKEIEYHNMTPLTAAAFGRTATASIYMASTLKNDRDKLSITVSGNGVGGKIITSCDGTLNIRGYIENPRAELPLKPNGKLDVAGCVGKGRINVVRSMGLKEPYTGSSEIISGEIAEDFSYYYLTSEQEPTAFALGVLCKDNPKCECIGAGGVIFSLLPFASEESIRKVEEMCGNFKSISSIISSIGAQGIMKEYFPGVEFDYREIKNKCVCSNNYIDRILLSLGEDEALDIIKERGNVEIKCEYCEKNYIYDLEKVKKIFSKSKKK